MKNSERVQLSKNFKVGDWVQEKGDCLNSKIVEITKSGYLFDDLGRTLDPSSVIKNNPKN